MAGQGKEKIAILVAGMHRSGTSLLTRVLNISGCDLPVTLLEADSANETGYWESMRITFLNDEILASAESSWFDWNPFNPQWYASPVADRFRRRAQEILENEFGDSSLFVLKDPRICRLMPFWIEAVRAYGAEPMIVSPVRNPLDVAASLKKRNGIDPSIGHLLWLRHVLDAEKDTRGMKRAWLRYDTLLSEATAVVDEIGDALGVSWPRSNSVDARIENDEFIAPGLRHHWSSDAQLLDNPEFSHWVKSIFGIFNRWSGRDVHDEDVEELDRVRSAFDTASPAFNYALAASDRVLAERDKRIEWLNQALVARDTRIEELDRAVVERDRQIGEKDRETEVLFGRIRAIRQAQVGEARAIRRAQRAQAREVKASKAEVKALEARLARILRSNSWAVTAPMRAAKNVMKNIVMRLPPPRDLGERDNGPDLRTLEASSRRVNVIIPVYNNLHGTRHCVERVLASLEENDCEGTVTVINDGSTEEGVCEYLREIAAMGCMVLHNRKNLGFVKTVNRGLQNTRPQDDVVLLNSDTEVNGDWLDRLRQCAYRDGDIGTVTPFSNNAESCSFPSVFHDNTLPPGTTAATIDAVFAEICGYDPIDLPSSVGFCMFIKRDCLDAVGSFDAWTYGKGYGEENDFSLRASRIGWRDVLCPNVFVFHEGGSSFGSEQKNERIEHAMKTINAKYPHYAENVRRYAERDPAKDIRLKVMLDLLRSSDKPVILHLTHGLGGGTDKHVFNLIDFLGDRAFGIIARPSGSDTCVLVLDGRKQTLTLSFSRERQKELMRFLSSLRVSKVHVHQGYRVPYWMTTILTKHLGVSYDMTVHDFFHINGNPHLIDENGRFCADEETRDKCCATDQYLIPEGLPPKIFRERNARLFKEVDRVLVPSQYTRDLIGRYFPDANYILADHHDRELAGPYPSVVVRPAFRDEKMRIAILGKLGPHKGADILDYVAMQMEAECEFHLFGTAYRPLDAAIMQHGSYAVENLPALIDMHDPSLIWFPALWPETYAYTLSEALYSGRPIVAPDIGSFPERTRNRPYTYIEPWNKPKSDWLAFFRTLKAAFQNESPRALPWRDQPRFAFRYGRDYLPDHDDGT